MPDIRRIPPFPRPEPPPKPAIVVPRPPVRRRGPIGAMRPHLSDEAFAQFKAFCIARDFSADDFTFRYDDLEIITTELSYERGMLKLVLRATWQGGAIPIDNPLYIGNPPIDIVDSYYWTISGKSGEIVVERDTHEDPLTAVRMQLVNVCSHIAGVRVT